MLCSYFILLREFWLGMNTKFRGLFYCHRVQSRLQKNGNTNALPYIQAFCSLPLSCPVSTAKTKTNPWHFLSKSFSMCSPLLCQPDGKIKISCFVLCETRSCTEGVESAGPLREVNPSLRIEVFALPQLLGQITGEWGCGWLANPDRSVVELAIKSISEAQQFPFNSKHEDQPEILYLKLDFNLFWFHAHANIHFSLVVIDSWRRRRWRKKLIYMGNYLLKCLLNKRCFVGLATFNYIYQL